MKFSEGVVAMDDEQKSVEVAPSGWQLALGLSGAFLVYYLASVLGWLGMGLGPKGPVASIFWKSLAVLAILSQVCLLERRRLSSIGIAWPSERQVNWAFYLWGVALGWYWLASSLVPPTQNEGLAQITRNGPWVVLFIVISAAIGEEVFFRGYLIERIREWTGQLWLGALVSFAIFLVPHVQYFGWGWLLYHSVGTVMLYVLYLTSRNLVAVMLLHLLINLPVMIPTLMNYFSSRSSNG